MAPAAPAAKSAYDIGKCPGRVSRQIGGRLAFQVYPQLGCDGDGKVVDFVYEGVNKLLPARCGADKYDGLLSRRVGEGETAVQLAVLHELPRLPDKLPAGSAGPDDIKYLPDVVSCFREKEAHLPAAYTQPTPYHSMSSQNIGMFFATVLIQNSSKARVGEPSMSSR